DIARASNVSTAAKFHGEGRYRRRPACCRARPGCRFTLDVPHPRPVLQASRTRVSHYVVNLFREFVFIADQPIEGLSPPELTLSSQQLVALVGNERLPRVQQIG